MIKNIFKSLNDKKPLKFLNDKKSIKMFKYC